MRHFAHNCLLLLLALAPLAIQLTGCGDGPAGVAYTRGHYFKLRGNEHWSFEDPLSDDGIAEYKNAIEQFNVSLKFRPRYPEALKERSECQQRIGNLDSAVKDASELIAICPERPDGWRLRANVYRLLELYDRAVLDIKEVLRRNGKDAAALVALGCCENNLGHYLQAQQAFQQAADLEPKNPDVYVQRALAQLRTGSAKDIEPDLQAARKASPHSAAVYQDCGYCEIVAGNYKQANIDLHHSWAFGSGTFRSSRYTPILGALSCALTGDRDGQDMWIHLGMSNFGLPLGTAYGAGDAEPDTRWPNAALQYVSGDITQAKLLAQAGSDSGRMTEAHCYIGLNKLAAGDKKCASEQFAWVHDHGNKNYVEYDIAVAKLRSLQETHTTR